MYSLTCTLNNMLTNNQNNSLPARKINEASSEIKKWEDYDKIICPDGTMIDMAALIEEQNRARVALLHLVPWFAEVLGRFRFIYTFQVQTQATDSRDIYINPQFTAGLSFEQKVFVMAHEIMHCVLNHFRRADAIGADPTLANVAGDYEINITLASDDVVGGKPLISYEKIAGIGALIDKKYNGWGFEKIYADRPSVPSGTQQPKQQSKQQSNQQPKKSKDWVDGWNQAMEDYKNGKLTI